MKNPNATGKRWLRQVCQFVKKFLMKKLFGIFLLLCALPVSATNYVVLTWRTNSDDAAWKNVAEALAKKHDGTVIYCDKSLAEAQTELSKIMPRYVAVVARPDQLGAEFINQFHRQMRTLDADPYTDAQWGVVTGRTADDAMKMVKETSPLVIKRTASATRIATNFCQEAECFDELIAKGHSLKKADGKEIEIPLDDADSVAELAAAFAHPDTQLIITSGHASQRDWQPGFRYKNGTFHSKNGDLYGLDLKKNEYPVQSQNAKVYLPCGNCLMGLIDGPDAIALAWMHSAGVRQMAGYVEPTWYGYMGWGMMDYFVEQPGRYTFTESFFANNIALVHRLATVKGLSAQDQKGLDFDRDMVAFYGDPAWSATMMKAPLPYEQKLTQSAGNIIVEINPLEGYNSYEQKNTNGSQRGGRPFIVMLPERIEPDKMKLISPNENSAVLADNFVLIPRPPQGSKAQAIRVEWKLVAP